jgi:protocatechuate 3,4-dioxygenase beta subunit
MSFIDKPFRPFAPATQPDNDSPPYRSTILRHPLQKPLKIPQTITELSGPRFTEQKFPAIENLALNDGREAQGERIIVEGQIRDEDGRPVPHRLINISKASAASSPMRTVPTALSPSSPAPTLGPTTIMPGGRTIFISLSSAPATPRG